MREFVSLIWCVGVSADEVINAYIAKEKVFRSHLQNAHFVKGKHEYFPIPQSMIDICGTEVMKQNPGY